MFPTDYTRHTFLDRIGPTSPYLILSIFCYHKSTMDENPTVSGTIPVNPNPEPTPQPVLPPPAPEPLLPSPAPNQALEPIPVVSQPEPEKELYTWEAPSRPFKKRNREFYTTVGALVILVSVILLFAKEFLLIGVILSLGFVTYVLATIPPHPLIHRLTNKGIRTADRLYLWQNMGRYWWETKWRQDMFLVEVPGQFPGRLTLLLGKGEKAAIDKIMDKYLIKQKPIPTWFDKAADWLSKKVPLETEESVPPSHS